MLTALALLLSAAVMAQGRSSKEVVDKIIGVVGDRIILYSDIQNAIKDAARYGEKLPPNANCMIFEQALLSKILALQAERDSIPLTDEEVEAQMDVKVRNLIMQYGSQAEVETLAGKTIYQLKDDQRPLIRENMLAEAMRKKVVSGVHITPTEVKAFFEKVPVDSLPFLESELEVGQISILPSASKDVDEYIYNEMLNYKKQIESGTTTFEALAKRVSEDPGSRERGGSYEINRSDKSTWDPVFLSTAFRLKAGEISQPVKSNRFGYFLIQQVSRRGDNAQIKMILRVPPVTDNELKEAHGRLDSVRAEIESNKISFKDAAYKYSDDENVKNYGPYVLDRDGSTYVNIDALDRDMVNTIKDMKVGDLSQPVNFTNDQGKKGVRLVYLKSRSEPHRLNLNDDYVKIADMALNQKRNEELDKWLEKKIPTFYILIDKQQADSCPSLSKYQTTENRGF
ncbi:periplasmic chaperone for outer membrane proteins SurA [Niabella drilacis]|uniref:Periplasmic chaperone for outer membrane proteins SurA n=2 Tax=Niabella drilacis (strain DSM 25811 / CCM 8410 / CCUG 62505 / LMG 26954 / E90) TaxID=1285928 RepID=A0A1G6N4B9_NIADE|nr:periplasmic chaperone for outer membrane proteins SurA [Niabella drilacis]